MPDGTDLGHQMVVVAVLTYGGMAVPDTRELFGSDRRFGSA